MLIWLLAVVLIGAFAAIGYGKGAIRMLFSILGLFLGAGLAMPLGPTLKPLIRTTNPILGWLLPPLIVFFTISIVFIIIGFVVHRFVDLHFKYKVEETRRISWDRLNKRVGAAIGVFAGASYTVLISVVIYFLGYVTVQVASAESDAVLVRYLNQARGDLRSSGLEKMAAVFDPMPDNYYVASDILGLVYNNPIIHSRLSNYPVFLALGERPEFQEVANDTSYQEMLQSKSGIGPVLKNPKTQAIMNNQEIVAELQALDLKDLRAYLETGKSPKYDETRILGRWHIDVPSVITQAKIQSPVFATNAFALGQLRKFATNFLPGITVIAAADSKLYVKMGAQATALAAAAAAAAQADPNAAAAAAAAAAPQPAFTPSAPPSGANSPTTLSAQLRQRYGVSGGTPQRAPAPVAVAQAAPPVRPRPASIPGYSLPKTFKFSGQGTWQGSGDDYELAFTDENGTETKVKGKVDKDKLLLAVNAAPTLVLLRAQ